MASSDACTDGNSCSAGGEDTGGDGNADDDVEGGVVVLVPEVMDAVRPPTRPLLPPTAAPALALSPEVALNGCDDSSGEKKGGHHCSSSGSAAVSCSVADSLQHRRRAQRLLRQK